MNTTTPTASADAAERSLHDARQALAHGDMQAADAAYLRHFRYARNDASTLAEFGLFCLQTGRPAGGRYLLHRASALQPHDIALRCQLGYAHLEARQHDLARTQFEGVLRAQPDHTQATYGLGLCLLAQADAAAAVLVLERAFVATPAPSRLPVMVRLAEACHQAGNDDRARMLFTQARQLAPDHPAVMLAAGRFLRESGDAGQALPLIERCVRADPNEPRLLLEMARCQRLLGNTAQALAWLEHLGRVAPTLPDGAEESGNCLLAMGRIKEGHELWVQAIDGWIRSGDLIAAEALLDRLLAAAPEHAGGWNARGSLAAARQDFVAAEAAWRRAIASDPRLLAAAANLALQLENGNRLDLARPIAEQALPHIRAGEQEGSAASVLLALARVERRQKAPERGLALLARKEADGADDVSRAAAAFERGKQLDALGRFDEAMAAFVIGNEAAAREWQRSHPEENQVVAGIDYVLGLIDAGLLQRMPAIPDLPEHPPIAFLLSFPRSGTTLLNQVLDVHPEICTMDELPPAAKLVHAFRDIPGGYPQALGEIDAIDVGWLRDAYWREVVRHVHPQPGQLLLDKFPTSTVLAAMLHRVFPAGRFVFALRHPCDVVLSCFMQGFQLSDTMFNFCTLADTVTLYDRTMQLWHRLCEQLPLPVHVIRYESVVDDFDGELAALCSFLGVPWRDELRDYTGKAMARAKIRTPSYEQIIRPIYREARGRWQHYRKHLEPHLPILQPWIERFGYVSTDITTP